MGPCGGVDCHGRPLRRCTTWCAKSTAIANYPSFHATLPCPPPPPSCPGSVFPHQPKQLNELDYNLPRTSTHYCHSSGTSEFDQSCRQSCHPAPRPATASFVTPPLQPPPAPRPPPPRLPCHRCQAILGQTLPRSLPRRLRAPWSSCRCSRPRRPPVRTAMPRRARRSASRLLSCARLCGVCATVAYDMRRGCTSCVQRRRVCSRRWTTRMPTSGRWTLGQALRRRASPLSSLSAVATRCRYALLRFSCRRRVDVSCPLPGRTTSCRTRTSALALSKRCARCATTHKMCAVVPCWKTVYGRASRWLTSALPRCCSR
mmetsp:Transcript_6902/g.22165  ORF Transcript_6902/g.22165 Transcript_6902/m.22165 type:complete len:316 (+) Transcript_6902:241-1188(+)